MTEQSTGTPQTEPKKYVPYAERRKQLVPPRPRFGTKSENYTKKQWATYIAQRRAAHRQLYTEYSGNNQFRKMFDAPLFEVETGCTTVYAYVYSMSYQRWEQTADGVVEEKYEPVPLAQDDIIALINDPSNYGKNKASAIQQALVANGWLEMVSTGGGSVAPTYIPQQLTHIRGEDLNPKPAKREGRKRVYRAQKPRKGYRAQNRVPVKPKETGKNKQPSGPASKEGRPGAAKTERCSLPEELMAQTLANIDKNSAAMQSIYAQPTSTTTPSLPSAAQGGGLSVEELLGAWEVTA